MASRPPVEEATVLAVRKAVEAGANEAEAYALYARGYEVFASNNKIVNTTSYTEVGVGIRSIVGKKIGFSYASSLDKREIAEAAERSVKAAKVAPEDKEWRGLPEPSSVYPEPEGIYDVSLARVKPERLVEFMDELLSEILSDKRLTVVGAAIRTAVVKRVIASTTGVYRIDVGTICVAGVSVTAKEGDIVTPEVFEEVHTRVSLPSAKLMARRVVEKVTRSFRVYKLTEPRKMDVVLEPFAFIDIMAHTVFRALSGESILRGSSPYAGKVGEQIMDERLTIIDDGTLKQGLNTWRFDGEGVAMQRTVLVEKGIFKTPYYDSYWAKRAGIESTGNAVRTSYTAPPRIGLTNVVIEPGDAKLDELLEGEVLLVHYVQGAHSSNPATGEYSVLAAPAWLVKNGEYYLVRNVMLAGNIVEQLRKNVVAVGSWQEDLPGFKTPWIRLSGVTVTPRL